MTEYYSYVTKDNDRWDLISNQFYNTPTLYEEIIKANPTVKVVPILPSGIKLKIPILDQSETIKFELPPWKK
ncbi:tail protein X [bacterium]|nr:tail protein X [bacterium]